MDLTMTLDEILETAKNDYIGRQSQSKTKLKPINSSPLPFKTKPAVMSIPEGSAKHIPATSPFKIKPNQKLIDPTIDAKRIATGLVDANKGKIDEAKRNNPIKSSSVGLTEPEVVNEKSVNPIKKTIKNISAIANKTKNFINKTKDTKLGKVASAAAITGVLGMGGLGLTTKKLAQLKK